MNDRWDGLIFRFLCVCFAVGIGCAGADTGNATGSGCIVFAASSEYGRCAHFCQFIEFRWIGGGEEYVQRRHITSMFAFGMHLCRSQLSGMQRTFTIFERQFATWCSGCRTFASIDTRSTSVAKGTYYQLKFHSNEEDMKKKNRFRPAVESRQRSREITTRHGCESFACGYLSRCGK